LRSCRVNSRAGGGPDRTAGWSGGAGRFAHPLQVLRVGLLVGVWILAACGAPHPTPLPASPPPTATATHPPPAVIPSPTPTLASRPPGDEPVPVYTCRVVNIYPHDRTAFTEGLVFQDGVLYESTGLNGQSTLRRVELETGRVLQRYDLPARFFGEGMALYGHRIIQLTWQSHVGFVYDRDSFELQRTFTYPTEGWGLTHDGQRLIMSDGTAILHFLNPETFEEVGQIEVQDNGRPVLWLNELEYIAGEIYANVWQTDLIARIDPHSGRVTGWIDLTGLLGPEDYAQPVDVLNGIAYDAERDRLFVTGKWWPKLFEIELVRREG